VDGLLTKAEILYATRSLESARQAADLWLDAARADPDRTEGWVGAARASVWLANHETDPERRLQVSEAAVQASQWCAQVEPESPVCTYWLGAALGVQARERRSTALDALPRIVEAFQRAAAMDPALEEAGPDRALALLYARAPGWPTGPGDPDLAVEHARKAADLRPGHPPNQLALGEALAGTGDMDESRAAYRRALEAARKRAAGGDPDGPEWVREAEGALGAPGDV
jgi:tetratricopeptide (TPR) repeat protein